MGFRPSKKMHIYIHISSFIHRNDGSNKYKNQYRILILGSTKKDKKNQLMTMGMYRHVIYSCTDNMWTS